jgi:DNA-binding transcriptional regulator of glucitol operon
MSSSAVEPKRYRGAVSTTRRRRPALILLVAAAAAGCLALAWWQWTRWESTSGSFQNLGYALQWPMFAGFCVYAYYKFVRYEEAPPAPRDAVTEIPADLLPQRTHDVQTPDDDPALREYNAYLADLAEADLAEADNEGRTTP